MTDLMVYLGGFFIALNLTYVLGNVLFCAFVGDKIYTSENKYLKDLIKIAIGLVTMVFTIACIKTQLQTVNLLLVIPFLFIIKSIKTNRWKHLIRSSFSLKINILALIANCIQIAIFYSSQHQIALSSDLYFYAELSSFLQKGHENIYGVINEMEIDNFPRVSPYHYFDIWITAIFSSIFSLSNPKILLIITYPLLLTGYLTGIFAIAKSYLSNIHWSHYLILPLLFFIGPIILVPYTSIFNTGIIVFENTGFFQNTLPYSFYGQKHLVFYVISILFLNLHLLGLKKEALLLLCIAPIVNIGLLPGIAGGLSLFHLIHFIKHKNFKKFIQSLFPIALVSFGIISFYLYLNWGTSTGKISDSFLYSFESHLNLKGEVIRFILRIGIAIIWTLIIYLPYAMLLMFLPPNFIMQKFKIPIQLAVCFLIVASLTRPFLDWFDSAQFLTYTFPFTQSLLIALILFAWKNTKYRSFLFLGIFAVVCWNAVFIYKKVYLKKTKLYELYDENYMFQVSEFLKTQKELTTNYGFILPEKSRVNTPVGFWYAKAPMHPVKLNNFHNCYSLNYPFKKNDAISLKSSDYANHQLLKLNEFVSPENFEKTMMDFIKTHKIVFIITKTNVLDDHFKRKYVKREIVDNKSGEVFIILK